MNNHKHFKLRIPNELSNWITKQAEENKRSLNAQILYCIEQTRKKKKRKKAAASSPNAPAASLENNNCLGGQSS